MTVDLLAIRDVGILFLGLVYAAVLVGLKATQHHKATQRQLDR